MRAALISFTKEGAKKCRKIEIGLTAQGYGCSAFGKEAFAVETDLNPLKSSLAEWTADHFFKYDALIFISACGIAVRAIAPHIKDKTIDPAVIVVDELGKYAISLLSGHLGGANDIAREIAAIISAEPIITTATDLNQRFSVDDWAKKNHLRIGSMQIAKEISAAVLNGERIGVSSEFPIQGQLPEQLQYLGGVKDSENGQDLANQKGMKICEDIKIGFRISIHQEDGPFEKTLLLTPQTVAVGMGCRKGISLDAVEKLFYKVLKEQRLSIHSVEKLCSIDIKKEEAALNQLADKLGIPLQFFSAEELEQLAGEFSSSDFVNHITGVDNVCERAAVLGSQGQLIVKKQALNGVTAAIAVRTEKFLFG